MDATSQDPDVLGGELVFAGTRVPVKSLFDHLEGGDSIEDFLNGFPSGAPGASDGSARGSAFAFAAANDYGVTSR